VTRRCHLCGREGSRDFLLALARTIVPSVSWPLDPRSGGNVEVTICRAWRACNLRRGVS
jgi:hypothetical protein